MPIITEIQEVKVTDRLLEQACLLPKGERKPNSDQIINTIKQNTDAISVYQLTYLSRGFKIKAFLARPKQTGRYPVLFYNRGGTGEIGKSQAHHFLSNFFGFSDIIKQGYALVTSQLAGIDGGEDLTDAGGIKDFTDTKTLLQALPEIDCLDTDKIAMLGASSGANLNYRFLREENKLAASIIVAGNASERLSFEFRPEMKEFRRNFYDTSSESEILYRSALEWVRLMHKTTPVLILHGISDNRVPVNQSITMTQKMIEQAIPVSLKLFAGDNHALSESRKELGREILEWLQKYVKDQAPLPNVQLHDE
jgi:dipeptidyl aminopeptidase/acylaminoacyl peptidase